MKPIQLTPKPVNLTKKPPELEKWPHTELIKLGLKKNTRIGKAVPVHVEHKSNMKKDYRDLRFYDSEHAILPYWISKQTKEEAVCWVRLTGQAIADNYIMFAWGNKNAVFKGSHASSTFKLRMDKKKREVLDKQLYKPQPISAIRGVR